jgi:hypothetical protein
LASLFLFGKVLACGISHYIPQYVVDAYFWKGLLLAYYYRGKSHAAEVVESIERAVQDGLPPILLTPLYWLEKDTPAFFTQRIQPLLQKYLE